jgi:hypothetical protein
MSHVTRRSHVISVLSNGKHSRSNAIRPLQRILALLIVIAVAAQFFLAAAGSFDAITYSTHRALGSALGVAAVAALLIALLARRSRSRLAASVHASVARSVPRVERSVRARERREPRAADSATTDGPMPLSVPGSNPGTCLQCRAAGGGRPPMWRTTSDGSQATSWPGPTRRCSCPRRERVACPATTPKTYSPRGLDGIARCLPCHQHANQLRLGTRCAAGLGLSSPPLTCPL